MPPNRVARLVAGALASLLLACAGNPAGPPAAARQQERSAPAPAGGGATGPVPAGLPTAADWVAHLERDLIPFWTHPEALGRPVGAFPTFRCHDGRAWDPAAPCPELAEAPEWIRGALGRDYLRMRSRQTYLYGAAFHLTGDERYLELARAGVEAIRATVEADGSVPSWLEGGRPLPAAGERTTQDLAYAQLGLAMYWYLTREPEVLDTLLRVHDHVFAAYWRADWGMLAWTREGPEAGRQELVAQLDPVNAYLLLVAPLLPEPHRGRWLADLDRLAGVIVERYWDEELGLFWGRIDDPGERRLGGRHVDFGHSIKALWMLERLAAATGDGELAAWARPRAERLLARAFVAETGCWAEGRREDGSLATGLTWWSFAELDQAAATLALAAPGPAAYLPATAACWQARLVDREHGGVWAWADAVDPERHYAKAHLWKNGYHEAEHALVMALTAAALRGEPAAVWFALPAGAAVAAPAGPAPPAAAATPVSAYLFGGTVATRRPGSLSRLLPGHRLERLELVDLR